VGLAQEPADEAFRNHVLKFFAEDSTRAAAVEAMWRSGEEIYIPSFRTALHDSGGEVRLQAVRGVGAFPIPSLAIEMIPLFSDEELREDALYAYASAVNAKITPKSVHRLLEEIEKKADGLSQEEMEIVTEALDRAAARARDVFDEVAQLAAVAAFHIPAGDDSVGLGHRLGLDAGLHQRRVQVLRMIVAALGMVVAFVAGRRVK